MIDYRPAVTRRYVPNIKPTNEEILKALNEIISENQTKSK